MSCSILLSVGWGRWDIGAGRVVRSLALRQAQYKPVRSDGIVGPGVGWVAVAIAVAGSFPRVRSGGLSAGMMPVSGVWRAFSALFHPAWK